MGFAPKQSAFPEDSCRAGTEDGLLIHIVNSGNLFAELHANNCFDIVRKIEKLFEEIVASLVPKEMVSK